MKLPTLDMAGDLCCTITNIRNLCNRGSFLKALDIVKYTSNTGCGISPKVFYVLLQACTSKAHLGYGISVFHLISKSGLTTDAFLGSHLIRMFSACGDLAAANQIFETLAERNKFSWSAIILANANSGAGRRALELYYQMQRFGVQPDAHIFVAVLKACGTSASLKEGKDIEDEIESSDCKSNPYVGNALIDMFMKCGSLEDAVRIFHALPKQDPVTWNSMLSGYLRNGWHDETFKFFARMQKNGVNPDASTFVNILKACRKPEFLMEGNNIHCFIIENGLERHTTVGNSLIHMYAVCGGLIEGRYVFDSMPKQEVVTWNSMMNGYVQCGNDIDTIHLFELMQMKGLDPNRITFLCILKACSRVGYLDLVRKIHASIVERCLDIDIPISNSLIDAISKCGSLADAKWIFEVLSQRTIVSCNTIISSFIEHRQMDKALGIFCEMLQKNIEPDQTTFVNVLKVCSTDNSAPHQALEFHFMIVIAGFECEIMVGNALIDIHTRCGSLADAQIVFDRLCEKDTVSWNTIITGYVHYSRNEDALLLFQQMQLKGGNPDRATFLIVIKACGGITASDLGNIMYTLAVQFHYESDEMLQSAIIHMYIRCGDLENATRVFHYLSERDLVTWNALIAGYALCGDRNSVNHFLNMLLSEGMQPDDVTFVNILSAVTHSGSVKEAHKLFSSMQSDYNVEPSIDHFNCLIDLLGRAGFVEEAQDLIRTMPSIPNIIGWTSLLDHSKTYGKADLGKSCYNNFLCLCKEDATAYSLMQHISASL